MAKSKFAAALSGAKKILGAETAKPATVLMPQTVAEIHVKGETRDKAGNVMAEAEYIPHNTLLTPELAELAGLEQEDIDDLLERGHLKLIEVYAGALTDAADPSA